MTNAIYAGGLSPDTVDEELKTFFQQAGTVRSARVITHPDSGRSKGFGVVEMSSATEAEQAISRLNGRPLRDRPIHVRERMSESASAVAPPRWTLSTWARLFRRLTHWWFVARYVRRFCSPLEVDGMENLATLTGPAIFVANHTSHFDAYVVRHILPARLRNRAAMAAAADRWYTSKKLKVAWLSLNLNIYPILRGGGRASLAHSEWLLTQGWSLIIFPEGTRAKKGYMEALKNGVAILALAQNVPVVPIHLRGVDDVLAPRTRALRRAPVWARIGEPIALGSDQSLPEATAALQAAMRDPAQVHAVRPQDRTDRSPVEAIRLNYSSDSESQKELT